MEDEGGMRCREYLLVFGILKAQREIKQERVTMVRTERDENRWDDLPLPNSKN